MCSELVSRHSDVAIPPLPSVSDAPQRARHPLSGNPTPEEQRESLAHALSTLINWTNGLMFNSTHNVTDKEGSCYENHSRRAGDAICVHRFC